MCYVLEFLHCQKKSFRKTRKDVILKRVARTQGSKFSFLVTVGETLEIPLFNFAQYEKVLEGKKVLRKHRFLVILGDECSSKEKLRW